MITINGKKMGKSYNNVITLTQMFSGDHPMLEKAYSPMTVRFFILQTHYRSTLDFSNEALIAAEKGLKRLMDALETLEKIEHANSIEFTGSNTELNKKVELLLEQLDDFMNDDFNTAKVLANLFDLVPVINSIKDRHISLHEFTKSTFELFAKKFKTYVNDVLGLRVDQAGNTGMLNGTIQLLIDIRKEAKSKKDYATSDKIRQQLQQYGILLKDEKDGSVSWNTAS
jgi:cysteinyl-tRNA synthetase